MMENVTYYWAAINEIDQRIVCIFDDHKRAVEWLKHFSGQSVVDLAPVEIKVSDRVLQ
jgi:hypothetical protein